jgi:hypothetical protein
MQNAPACRQAGVAELGVQVSDKVFKAFSFQLSAFNFEH